MEEQKSQSVKDIYFPMFKTLALTGEYSEKFSMDDSHIVRVGLYSKAIFGWIEKSPKECERIALAAMLHDVGKVGLPTTILRKLGPYSDEETKIMTTHTLHGYKLLHKIDTPLFHMAANIALSHHERWNGGGYPKGWGEKRIPLEARVVALADAFDALSLRQHQFVEQGKPDAFTDEKIKEVFAQSSRVHFDPDLIDVALKNFDQLVEIRNANPFGGMPASKEENPSAAPQSAPPELIPEPPKTS